MKRWTECVEVVEDCCVDQAERVEYDEHTSERSHHDFAMHAVVTRTMQMATR